MLQRRWEDIKIWNWMNSRTCCGLPATDEKRLLTYHGFFDCMVGLVCVFFFFFFFYCALIIRLNSDIINTCATWNERNKKFVFMMWCRLCTRSQKGHIHIPLMNHNDIMSDIILRLIMDFYTFLLCLLIFEYIQDLSICIVKMEVLLLKDI